MKKLKNLPVVNVANPNLGPVLVHEREGFDLTHAREELGHVQLVKMSMLEHPQMQDFQIQSSFRLWMA